MHPTADRATVLVEVKKSVDLQERDTRDSGSTIESWGISRVVHGAPLRISVTVCGTPSYNMLEERLGRHADSSTYMSKCTLAFVSSISIFTSVINVSSESLGSCVLDYPVYCSAP